MRIIFLLLLSVAAFGQDFAWNHPNREKYQELFRHASIDRPACNCDFIIPTSAYYVDTDKAANLNAYVINPKPGQTVCFAGGTIKTLEIHDIVGTKDAPISFRSCGGTTFTGASGQHVVQFFNSSFVRFIGDDGTGGYGAIDITGGGHGLYFTSLSTDAECGFVKFHDLGYSGFEAKTDPTCDPKTWRGNFTMYNIWLHDNGFINIKSGEAVYIGESHYSTIFPLTNCGAVKSALEHEIKGVIVERNTFENIGRDPIQVGSATERCYIRYNRMKLFGQTHEYGQGSGIIANPGTMPEIYENVIDTGDLFGIQLQGNGGARVHHNLILNTGKATDGGGIMISVSGIPGKHFIYNNTLLNVNRYGIEYFTTADITNNIINVKAGSILIKPSGPVAITDEGNIKLVGDPLSLRLDANYIPAKDSPAWGPTADAGAFQSVKVRRYTGDTWEASDSLGFIKVWLISGDGQKIRIK